ncbi:BamA/TamA family outer membrane protein, partial [Candidatus Aerophobetes bacterium]|nr:BamA/TamA family outer membrane protein [Candidatus Aerophobetes bacterium]
FTKYSAELRTYHRLQDIETSPTLAIRMRKKWGENLPAEEEFYVGGQETLRGYEVNSFRGSEALLGTVEMRFPFADNLLGYFFVDFGIIKTSTKSEEKTGYGFGVKITTPIGPLRLDYGIGKEGSPRFYFGMIDVF